MKFPEGFLWGAATSAYQIEGAHDKEGKGESIWDRFTHAGGNIKDGSTGDVACDHYHRYRDDVALMKELRLNSYRFSVSWPRVMPEGKGWVNEKGLDFYTRLVDALLESGIQPLVTLYHWDLPQELQEKGGWANRDIKGWFGDYAAVMAEALGDRVKLMTTFNEPQIFSILGYLLGQHAPGIKDPLQYFAASHFINLAHGNAVTAIRDTAGDVKVGTALQLPPVHPSEDADEDAAKRIDGLMNRWYAEPVLLGRYPEDMLDLFSPLNLPIEEGDMELIYKPLDFVGLNLYTRMFARRDPDTPLLEAQLDWEHKEPGARYTAMGWEIHPESIYQALMRIKNQWGDPEVYVTENGAAFDDKPLAGGVPDPARVDYLRAYLEQVHRAIEDGVKVKGYFAWTLMDNFEWAEGYTKRFGLVYTDYQTQKRIPKASAFFYRNVIENNGVQV